MTDSSYSSGEYVCEIVNHGRASSWGDDCDSWSMKEFKEEIVRCKNCKYNDNAINACNHPLITPLRSDIPINYIFSTVPDGFCSWGEVD